jgi:Lon protease-like protein
MFPLESVLLPGALLPLHVFEERYRIMTGECLEGDRTFGVVLIERGREVGGGDVRVDFGTTAWIEEAAEFSDGRYVLACRGVARLRVVEWLPDDPYPVAVVEVMDDGAPAEAAKITRAEECVRRAWALLSELGADSPLDLAVPGSSLTADRAASARPANDVWTWCALAPLTALDQLHLLRVEGHAERLDLLCELSDAVAEDARGMLTGGGG